MSVRAGGRDRSSILKGKPLRWLPLAYLRDPPVAGRRIVKDGGGSGLGRGSGQSGSMLQAEERHRRRDAERERRARQVRLAQAHLAVKFSLAHGFALHPLAWKT